MGRFAILIFMALALILASMKNWKYFLGLVLIFSAGLFGLLYFNMRVMDPQRSADQSGATIEIVRVAVDDAKKVVFLDDAIQLLLRDKYGLVVNAQKMDSREMAAADPGNLDGIWFADADAANGFVDRHDGSGIAAETICRSPLVLLTWADRADALSTGVGAVDHRADRWVVTDPKALFLWAAEARPWSDLGLRGQDAPLTVATAPPDMSPAGLALVGLVLSVLADPASDGSGLPPMVIETLERLELVDDTADGLFNRYMRQGQGAYPLIAAFEHQLVAFYEDHPDYRDRLAEEVRVLHFEPPLVGDQVYVALTEPGKTLQTALKDAEVQRILWERHGFRPVMEGLAPPAVLDEIGLPAHLEEARQPPSAEFVAAAVAEMVPGIAPRKKDGS